MLLGGRARVTNGRIVVRVDVVKCCSVRVLCVGIQV